MSQAHEACSTAGELGGSLLRHETSLGRTGIGCGSAHVATTGGRSWPQCKRPSIMGP